MSVYSEFIQTRWADNDVYGHVNNVAYYAYFDSVINRYLIAHGLDIHNQQAPVAYMVASSCTYLKSVAYPSTLRVDLRVAKLGNSSVTYAIELFDEENALCAEASLTHVYVDRSNNKPTPIPASLRAGYEKILLKEE